MVRVGVTRQSPAIWQPQTGDAPAVRFNPRRLPQHFNQERHIVSRDLYRKRRSAAPANWREVAAWLHADWDISARAEKAAPDYTLNSPYAVQ